MTKRAFLAVAGFLGLCFPLSAQQTFLPDSFSTLNNSDLRLPSLTLSDRRPFSLSGAITPPLLFNWMEPTLPDFLPALRTTAPPRANAAAAYSKDSSKEVVDMRPNLLDYAGGEVGFVYGRSTGKFSGDFEAGYITGWAGNDKFQISAGASYENSSVRFSRH